MRASVRTSLIVFGTLLLTLLAAATGRAAEPPVIVISGIDGEPLANVTAALRLPPTLAESGETPRFWLDYYLRKMPAQAGRALEPYGYYSSKVEVDYDSKTDPPTIRVVIDPGAPVRVVARRLEIVGTDDPELSAFLDAFPLPVGAVLQHPAYEQAKTELQALAVDRGFLDAVYTHQRIVVDPEAQSAEIELTLATGPRYRFGPIRFSGGDDYPERFLRRYLAVQTGDTFSFHELGKTQQQLLDSDRFESVDITPLRDEADGETLPVAIHLKPKAPKRLRPGIGYGTDTGARFFLRYQDVNVWHLGHGFDSELLIAERRQNLTANYTFPGYRNLDTLFALRGGYQAEQLDTYDTRYVFTEGEQLYGFSTGHVGSIFVRFQQEYSTISGSKITTRTLLPGVRYRFGTLDDPVRPRRGYRLALELRGSLDLLLSQLTLMQGLGDISWIQPLPWNSYLHLRGSAGTTLQKNSFDEIPASLRFFAGGDTSVRGYPYQSLGPTDAFGAVIGGKHLLVGSVEIEKRFLQNWATAAFYDIGNAFNTFADYQLADAAGVGLRYFTPVGPVRIDLARTLNADKNHYRVHLGLGVGW